MKGAAVVGPEWALEVTDHGMALRREVIACSSIGSQVIGNSERFAASQASSVSGRCRIGSLRLLRATAHRRYEDATGRNRIRSGKGRMAQTQERRGWRRSRLLVCAHRGGRPWRRTSQPTARKYRRTTEISAITANPTVVDALHPVAAVLPTSLESPRIGAFAHSESDAVVPPAPQRTCGLKRPGGAVGRRRSGSPSAAETD